MEIGPVYCEIGPTCLFMSMVLLHSLHNFKLIYTSDFRVRFSNKLVGLTCNDAFNWKCVIYNIIYFVNK